MKIISADINKDGKLNNIENKTAISDNYNIGIDNNVSIRIAVNGKETMVKYNACASELRLSELPCGGHGKCGKCKIRVSGKVSPLTESEKLLLTEDEIKSGVRLACHTFILGECTVEKIYEEKSASVLTGGKKTDFPLSPAFKKLAVAVDVGTTTVAARLISANGEVLSEYGGNNPQSIYGADVVSRIEAHLGGGGDQLASVIRTEICRAVSSLCEKAEKTASDIDGMVITGNTVMLYLLTNTSPEPLSHAPFTLTRSFGETLSAESLGISALNKDTEVYLPSCISAFVGADTTCAILTALARCGETDALLKDSVTLRGKAPSVLADIGTNGEMALWNNEKLLVCSTAAGPAFEGVGISRGMRGEKGAIDKVSVVNGQLCATVIGGGEPKGICGSGLIDAVAALLDTELLDETGYLEDGEITVLSPITLTDKDIRAVQLAKSAINAGIKTLIHKAGVSIRDLTALYIAGGFGNYLNKVSAGRIGLLPIELIGKTENIGNAALIGAEMLLLNKDYRASAERISADAVTVELSTSKYFSDTFISGMLFE